METFSTKIVNNIQEWRSRKLEKSAHFLLNIGISANVLTFFALLCGLLAVYFLFNNTFLFLLFALLHLLADAFDGVIARLTTTTSLGKFFDHILSDGLVTILPIIKMGFFLNDLYAYLAAGLFALALLFYALSQYQAPIWFMRLYVVMGIFIILLFPSLKFLFIVLYLSVAVAGAYSLARQLQWFLQKRHTS
ncbi:CDP-alcohol phosphatidyltransferase family protein [Candidatus Woesearchaeota archaeon]|nr:CDP-alcohol phosphatidyltransferase family protein [Candidatus Woesearchaeota archaeon]